MKPTPKSLPEAGIRMFYKFKSVAIIPLIAWLMLITCPLAAQTVIDSPQEEAEVDQQQENPDTENGGKKSTWGKFLPLPIFITEPAIGEGLGATLIYFHHEEDAKNSKGRKATTAHNLSKAGQRSKPPPTATAIFAAYTNNDTAAAGIGHSNSFLNDKYRLVAAAASARINSKFYVVDMPFNFSLDGNFIYANLKRRFGDSNAFFGIATSYLDAGVIFESSFPVFNSVSLDDFDFVDVGLAASLIYDTRDNTVMPNSGYIVDLTSWHYDEAFGGDFDYSSTRFIGNSFHKFGQKYVLGLRLDISQADGDVPFYAEPYVRLRGIPALRYQGKNVTVVEIEGRRRISDRWSASVFTGAGNVKIGRQPSETGDNINTVGIGARYIALREQDAWVGIDIAAGPEEVVVYIQMGQAW